MRKPAHVFGFLLLASAAGAAGAAGTPDAIPACLAKAGAAFAAGNKVAPAFLQGDFDGDGKPDYAVLVTRGRAQGVVVCRAAGAPVVLGAGTPFNDMADLDFSAWKVHRKSQRVARGMGAGRPPVLSGDAFVLEWEGGSGLVYWNGKRFIWYQQGD